MILFMDDSGANGVGIIEAAYYNAGATTATCTFGSVPADGEMLVAVVTHAGGTPAVTVIPSGFSLRLGTDVRQTIHIYEKVAASEASAAYGFTGTVGLGLVMYRLSPAQFETGGSNSTASGPPFACSSVDLAVPDGSVGIAVIRANGGLGTASFSNSYGSLQPVPSGQVASRTYTAGGGTENTTVTSSISRNADMALVIYKPL